jgi:hypothetical protein
MKTRKTPGQRPIFEEQNPGGAGFSLPGWTMTKIESFGFRLTTTREMIDHVLRIAAYLVKQSRTGRVLPVQADEVEAR